MNPELLARARGLLAQASVIAEASSSKLDSQKSKGQPDSQVPRIGGTSTFDFFAQRLAGCRSDKALQEVVSALESELEAIRKRPLSPKVKTKMEVLYGCWSEDHCRTVAAASGVSETAIRNWRGEIGQNPYWGRKAA